MGESDLDKILNIIPAAEIDDIVESVMSGANFDIQKEMEDKLPYTRRVGINDIVPEEYQQKLMQIDLTMSQCYWMIGDIAADLINSVNRDRAKELGKIVSNQDIFEAVGFFCHRTGRSVRYYYECARYFPVEVRQKYDVPFTVYADARWVKDWELMLQLAEANPMWSADRVRAEYYKTIGEEPPAIQKPEVLSSAPDSGAEVGHDDLPLPAQGEQWTGSAPGRFKEVLLAELDHTSDKLRNVVDRIPLPTNIRVRIGDVLLELADIALEIRREV